MAQYQLNTSSFQPGQVGGLYHIGLSNGTQQYGYVMQPRSPQEGFKESTNVTDKEKLTQYSSPNLIDRDLVYYPRVTQGDFSGGGLQAVFIDPTKYYDSDLEVRTPGYLTLRPGWVRTQLTTGLGGGVVPQSVAWKNDVWSVFGESNKYYNSAGSVFNPTMTCKFVDTDGNVLILGDGINTIKFTFDNTTFNAIANAIVGNFTGMWWINQGTNGRFVYYSQLNTVGGNPNNLLFKIDMNGGLPSNGVAVQTGSNFFSIVDLVEYQNGIAILTNDPGGTGFDVWYQDGINLTRIVRVNQYNANGICTCLGDLYVTAQSTGQFEAPVLIRISSGQFEVVVRTGSPLAGLTNASIGDPESTGQYVCFALSNPQLNGVTTTSYIGVYDVVNQTYSHLGNRDSLDNPAVSGIRQLDFNGRAVAFPMISSGTGYIQTQTNSSRLPTGNTYATSGTMVGSKVDFQTPGIPKRFRRIEAVHNKALATGESVKLQMFVDQDPVGFTSALTPTATVTNSTVGSTITQLQAGADTVGRTLYPVLVLNGPGTSTPSINRMAVEIGGTYIWDLNLDCTANRRLLNGQTVDPQGVTGKDLAFMLRNSYENGNFLTLYLAEGVQYTVTIESVEFLSPSYTDHSPGQQPVKADEEWLVHIILKQVA